ncbi:MAG: hypothetical protein DDT24_00763 [Chloroflexi bacterium]|nr:hypothetical protein [Chloroflexota bacterium]
MTKPIIIRELPANKVKQLLADKKFARFKPEACNQCGEKRGFMRRIFKITGVTKAKQGDDETQRLLQFHFKQRYAIDFIFFRTHGQQFFVDSAVCDSCQSTAVTYDIEIDDEVLAKIAEYTGRSKAQVKSGLEMVYQRLQDYTR